MSWREGSLRACEEDFRAAAKSWDAVSPTRALEATWDIASAANQYVDHAAPWTAAKENDTARVETILGTLIGILEALEHHDVAGPPAESRADADPARPPRVCAERRGSVAEVDPAPSRRAAPGFWGRRSSPTIDKDTGSALLERLVPKPEAPSIPPLSLSADTTPPPTTREMAHPSAPDTRVLITYEDFAKTDLRVGVVKTCERVKGKDKLLQLTVDLGEPELRQIVAGLALSFKPEELVGRRVVVVANLAPRDFGKGLVSNGMLLATGPSENLVLATVGEGAPPGARLK